MTEIIPAGPTQALSLPEQWRFAETVAASKIVPRAYQGDAGAVLVAVNLGSAMGLSPAESLYRIHVIEGKPSASAELITSNVRRAGHRLRIRGDAQSATVQIVRADDPDFTYEVTWTMADAQRAGLTGKQVWKAYPAAMLRARAITECARQACPEALYGVIYSVEEAQETAEPDARPKRESAADLIGEAPVAAEPTPEQEPAEPMVTQQQLKKIGAAMREAGITERAHALAYIQQAIDVEVASRSELTREQAGRLIDALEQDVAQQQAADAAGESDAAQEAAEAAQAELFGGEER
jgi:hypothetical protein